MPLPLIVDAHQDIAWNIQAFGRDYTRPAAETRRLETEANSPAIEHEGHTLLGWPEYQQGRVAIIFSTLFVTSGKARYDWETIFYTNFDEAHRLYREQLDVYHELTDRHPDYFQRIGSRADLEAVLAHWADASAETHPIGLVPLMEGAEGVRSPAELELWWQAGVRIIGLAWAGTRYCGGTREPGPLTDEGRVLIKVMAAIGFTLDISHMDELSARQSLDLYPGPVIASHANAAAIIPEYTGNRHLSDDVIKALIGRDGVMGLVPSGKFLNYAWQRGGQRDSVSLEMAAAHVDHICQLAGNTRHVGFGSDFDGGFGVEAVPGEVDTVADLQKLGPILAAKGYKDEEIAAIFGGNWIRHLQTHLPA
ncbi:MAG: membrane dipeptidase [Chloroflexi bacterium]|nr:membrane dipeptidase [Chloroflexota bacterium]